jgi:hypothetical protein
MNCGGGRHAGTWRILGYDESSPSLTLQHDDVTYITQCFQHLEPSLEANSDSRGIRAGWHSEWSTKDWFPRSVTLIASEDGSHGRGLRLPCRITTGRATALITTTMTTLAAPPLGRTPFDRLRNPTAL